MFQSSRICEKKEIRFLRTFDILQTKFKYDLKNTDIFNTFLECS